MQVFWTFNRRLWLQVVKSDSALHPKHWCLQEELNHPQLWFSKRRQRPCPNHTGIHHGNWCGSEHNFYLFLIHWPCWIWAEEVESLKSFTWLVLCSYASYCMYIKCLTVPIHMYCTCMYSSCHITDWEPDKLFLQGWASLEEVHFFYLWHIFWPHSARKINTHNIFVCGYSSI